MKRANLHSALVTACLRYLEMWGVTAWKNNTAAVKVGKRFFRCGSPGLPDILGILPAHGSHPAGRLAGFEVKTGRGRQTPLQQAAQANLERAGALYVVVRSIQDLEDLRRKGWAP